MATLSVLRYGDHRFIHSGTRFVIEEKDDHVYAIARETEELELVPLTDEEKAVAQPLHLEIEDGTLLQHFLEERRARLERHQGPVDTFTVPQPTSGIPCSNRDPGIYGWYKDGTVERMGDCGTIHA